MNTSTEKRGIVTVEYMRAVLCVAVMLFHAEVPMSSLLWSGVQAFFVLSAFFLLVKLYGSPGFSVGGLFKKRVRRLYLPYMAVVAFAVLFALLRRQGIAAVAADTAFHALGLQNFEWACTGYRSALQPMTAHTWTLGIEIWLYLLFLLLLKCVSSGVTDGIPACSTSRNHAWHDSRAGRNGSRRLAAVLILAAAACVLGRAAAICLGAGKYWVSLLPLSHLDSYAIGGLAAIAYHEKRDRLPRYAIGCTLTGGTLILISIFVTAKINEVPFGAAYALYGTSDGYLHHAFTGQIYLFLALFWVGVLFTMIAVSDRHFIKAFRPIVDMGRDSYHLYLFHWPIRTVCRYLVHNVWVVFLLTLVLSLAANKCYTILEKAVRDRLPAAR